MRLRLTCTTCTAALLLVTATACEKPSAQEPPTVVPLPPPPPGAPYPPIKGLVSDGSGCYSDPDTGEIVLCY